MFRKHLRKMGYCNIDDAVEFLMCGIALLPTLLMLAGFMLEGAAALVVLLSLTMAVGMRAPPLPSAEEEKVKHPDGRPDR